MLSTVLAEESMVGSRISGRYSTCIFGLFVVWANALLFVATPARGQAQGEAQQQSTQSTPQTGPSHEVPRGKKLILKDGSYQVVREYQRNGERVRYFSEERGDWEELPASMVDWDATARDAAASEKAFAALAEKVHKQEEAKRMDNVADIDASLQVGEGAFLPTGEGLFVVEGKSVRLLEQVGAQTKRDKLRTIGQIMSPVQIVPGKQKVVIAGAHATLRLRSKTPEFYLREPPPDPDRASPIERSSRPGETGPDVVLIRAKVMHNGRELESIKTLFGEVMAKDRNEIAIQRWEVAPSVYRFTLGEALTPGEYVVAEVLPDGLNFFVWDFGVDTGGGAAQKK
ncbi:MAG: hypothetical protein WBL63_12995 [Candidatus Acidiferrum sp.]